MKKPFLFTLVAFFMILTAGAQQLVARAGDKGPYLEHSVVASEGLYSIGRFYNVNPKHIAAFNGFELNTGLSIGQNIRIPLSDTNFNQKTSKGYPVYYIPQQGEGLMKVSNNNRKVTLVNLRAWNKLNGDNIRAGEKLIVGYLVSKDFKPELLAKTEPVQNEATKQDVVKQDVVKQDVARQDPVQTETARPDPVQTETARPDPVQTDPAKPEQLKKDVANTETKKQEMAQEQPAVIETKPVKETVPVITDPEKTTKVVTDTKLSAEDGFFKTYFDQQIKTNPVTKNNTVTAGIFRTTSGWQDAKYYLLIDGVPTGTIVRIINPDNNKAIYAKVLGEMNGIRQNQGLGIRISNAAASSLGVTDQEKFIVKVNY